MSNNRLVITGLDELREALRTLPEELTTEAAGIVLGTANAAAHEIVNAYPEGTGNLRKGVRVEGAREGFGVRAVVVNKAKHAWIFENGTVVRKTGEGWNRGAMQPPGRVFIPIMRRHRAAHIRKLIELVSRRGLVVTER